MNLNSFNRVISFMESFTNLEKKTDQYSVRTYRLDRMAALLDVLGRPQDSFKSIHVAGSKGKGSTASYIASGLQALGYKTGLYMSPHVSDYRERFTLAGKFFEDSLLISTGNLLAEKLEGFHFCDNLGENEPTTFELYTAFAFLLFKETHCQWAVIETGLGGRLDATNVIVPQASVLTPIELEHTEILGSTIELIATEKSKIIKKGVPCFVSYQKPEAMEVFEKEAKAQGSQIFELKDWVEKLSSKSTSGGEMAQLSFVDGYKSQVKLSMLGDVQAQNFALAILVLRQLGLYKNQTTEQAMENNLIPGRMEKVAWQRPLYLDGAHTVQSMTHLLNTFNQLYPEKTGACVFGSVKGKDFEKMASLVLAHFEKIVICRPGTFKKSDPQGLYSFFLGQKSENQVVSLNLEAKDALSWCLNNTQSTEPVLVCGSFYLAGAIKEELEEQKKCL